MSAETEAAGLTSVLSTSSPAAKVASYAQAVSRSIVFPTSRLLFVYRSFAACRFGPDKGSRQDASTLPAIVLPRDNMTPE
jgi:hypothetical protein